MRMVDRETNRTEHRAIDHELKRKRKTSEPLLLSEEKRAKQQVKAYQSEQDKVPDGLYQGAKKFYKGLKTQDGKSLWDKRKDKKR